VFLAPALHRLHQHCQSWPRPAPRPAARCGAAAA
jgi:hypothetical protein